MSRATAQEARALDIIEMDRRVTPMILGEALGISKKAAMMLLIRMQRKGLVHRISYAVYEAGPQPQLPLGEKDD